METRDKLSELYDEMGAYWAFGSEQFNEKKVEGVKYGVLFGNLICPVANAKELLRRMDILQNTEARAKYRELGAEKIISHEYFNYECQVSGDTSDAEDALIVYAELYPGAFTKEKMKEVFRKCWEQAVENDWF